MEFHKPKPIHNFREFLKEVGTIVLGVCIALGAEQTVEWWHWKNRIRDATEAMQIELRDDDGPQAYARMAMRDCFAGQLDAIQTAIESERPRKEIGALLDLYRPPNPTWDSHAWSAVLASDVGSHMPPSQMMNWSKPYDFVPALDKRNQQEREDWMALQLTHRDGEKLSSGEAEPILAAIGRLRIHNRGISGFSGALLRSMEETGVRMRQEAQTYILRSLRDRFHGCVVTPSLALPNTLDRFPSLRPQENSYAPGH